ncbi:hypothetical protein DFP72DRAFT_1079097 [Ephemerocybe angulata]|uniref:SET domain-containing protein n=1 Tax=Ephemerocybe angulata TaxID=980116 RepID=A0A8H6HDZ8_9AGAR|nr:hypothetical protein DFP72DRAFT_1079097 [Tulosesus angulatus]
MASAVVETLQNLPPCTSKSAIFIDDLVVLALFSPVKHLDSPLAHIPQTLGRSFTGTAQTLADIYNEFEAIKSELDLADPRTFLKLIKSTKMRLIRGNREIKAMGKEKHDLLEWCISAYSMLVIPSSSTRLRTLDLGGQKGFGVCARTPIPYNTTLHELLGMMPADNNTPHSGLSAITPSPSQDQPVNSERVLFGPLRLINHRCRTHNIAYMAIAETSAFVAYALRDIPAGEELTVNYGDNWFERDSCPCADCTTKSNTPPTTITAGKAAMEERSTYLQASGSKPHDTAASAAQAAQVQENRRRRKREYKHRQREAAKAQKLVRNAG